jgi:hypothetical protein
VTDTVSTPAIPEIGPMLGRLAEPARDHAGLVALDDIRLQLVSDLFELAGAARSFADAGDLASAAQSLNRHGWLAAWERAVAAAARRVAERIEFQLRSAAAESRLPKRRLTRVLLTDDERRGIAVRLGTGGALLVDALDEMEHSVRETARRGATGEAWREALTAVARRLESAWTSLERAAATEVAAWQEDGDDVRRWKRARWPLWITTVLVLALLGWLALVLGGFVHAPAWFRPAAQWWWNHGWA